MKEPSRLPYGELKKKKMSMFMCVRYDLLRDDSPVGNPIFFQTKIKATIYAKKQAQILESRWSSVMMKMMPRCEFYLRIFEIPFETEVVVTHDVGYENYELYDQCIDTVYGPHTTAAMIIQKRWRRIYNTRFASAAIIKKHLKRAISNPYTQLCRKRLLREFNEMN